jgi:hypothetical protein
MTQLSDMKPGSLRAEKCLTKIYADRHRLIPGQPLTLPSSSQRQQTQPSPFCHHASLPRRPLTSEFVQFRLVPVQRGNFVPDNQRVLRPFFTPSGVQ